MPCLNTLKKVQKRKRSSARRMSKSCTVCSLPWPMPAFQASAPQSSCCHSTESLSVARTSYFNYVSSGTRSEPNWVLKAHTKSALMPCVWGSKSCKNQTTKLKRLGRKDWRATIKRLMEYCTTRGYLLSQKPSKQSSSVDTMTTRL